MSCWFYFKQKISAALPLRFLICSAGLFVSAAYADIAPVVDLNAGGSAPIASVPRQSLPLDQRVTMLENQMNNLTQMNVVGKLSDMQQEIQQLTGQLEVQAHAIQTLTDQQKSFYQDLNQRLDALKAQLGNSGVGNAKTSASTATANANSISNTSADNAASSNRADNSEADYQAAFTLLANKQNAKAVTAFKAFLQKYPNSTYAVNAHYWLGEIYSAQQKNDLASAEFKTVIDNYPNNLKIPDAMLKLAVIHANAGKQDQARKELQQIIAKFPDSSAARLASLRLQQIKLQSNAGQ